MTFQVVIQPRAARDIDAAVGWIAERSRDAAVRRVARLSDSIDSLSDSPERCPLAPESRHFDREIRQLLFGKKGRRYRILFTISDGTVHVLHLRHWAQRVLEPQEIRGQE